MPASVVSVLANGAILDARPIGLRENDRGRKREIIDDAFLSTKGDTRGS